MITLNIAWARTLRLILGNGAEERAPRGKRTRNFAAHLVEVSMRHPVLLVPARKLSYQFMAAEAWWILSGEDRVETIAPWNQRIAQFSDDGKTFFGAYGPRIVQQLPFVVAKLAEDPETRQACLTTWRPSPPPTKDVPCTVAFVFEWHQGRQELDLHVFMRSSDAWLGLPYDVFNFSMLTHMIVARLRAVSTKARVGDLSPGNLYLQLVSSHIYEEHWEAARRILAAGVGTGEATAPTPRLLFEREDALFTVLKALRDSKPGSHLRWWEGHELVLEECAVCGNVIDLGSGQVHDCDDRSCDLQGETLCAGCAVGRPHG